MATQEEKITAAEAALTGLGTTDPAEAERFVALFDSQAALLPTPEATAEKSPVAAVLYSLRGRDAAEQERIDEHLTGLQEILDGQGERAAAKEG